MKKLVVFDLDGTLTNSIEDLTDAMNFALSSFGFPVYSVEECCLMVGNGVRVFSSRALPIDRQDMIDKVMSKMRSYYKDHYLDKTRPYDGISELIAQLRARDILLAVHTNKDQDMTEEIIDELFDRDCFHSVLGARAGMPLKPDPILTINLLEELGLKPEDALFVGDTNVDIQTGRNAGLVTVGVTWGFRTREELKTNKADYIIDKPAQLLELLT